MLWTAFKTRLRDFHADTQGTAAVEMVMTIPLLFLGLSASYEFFEIHRFQSARIKATYTVADMNSRENDVLTEVYMDNTKELFDAMTRDRGDNQVRVSVIKFNGDTDQYEVSWSRVRGSGSLNELINSDVANDHARLPTMQDGEEVIVVESKATYDTIFDVGLEETMTIDTRVFTSIRFAPQICFEQCS